MKIYKDILNGDELFSDIYPIDEVEDGLLYKVTGKLISRTEDGDYNTGANASAEEAAEGTDASIQSGINVVLNHSLTETGMNKKSFVVYIKGYMKSIVTHLEKNNDPDVESFKKNAQVFVKSVIGELSEYQFFQGEKALQEGEGMVVMVKWDGETPYCYFFKHGVEEEKV